MVRVPRLDRPRRLDMEMKRRQNAESLMSTQIDFRD
jgi:hypothetical protein